MVSPNLWAGLKAIYAYTHKENSCQRWLLWIDAICINQNDDDEKSSQVQRMGEIYGGAERVLVWLGSEADNSACVMSVLSWLEQWEIYRGAPLSQAGNRRSRVLAKRKNLHTPALDTLSDRIGTLYDITEATLYALAQMLSRMRTMRTNRHKKDIPDIPCMIPNLVYLRSRMNRTTCQHCPTRGGRLSFCSLTDHGSIEYGRIRKSCWPSARQFSAETNTWTGA